MRVLHLPSWRTYASQPLSICGWMLAVVLLAPSKECCGQAPVDIPQTNMTPVGPGTRGFSPPGSTTITPPPNSGFATPNSTPRIRPGTSTLFDAYQNGPTAGTFQPAAPPVTVAPTNPGLAPITPGLGNAGTGLTQPPAFGGTPSPGLGFSGNQFGAPAGTLAPGTSIYGAPAGANNWGATGPSIIGQPGIGGLGQPANPYPNTIYPSGTPSTLFPGGLFRGGYLNGGSGLSGSYTGPGSELLSRFQFVHGPRLRHTFINAGDGMNDLEINETDISVAFALPNFMFSNQPLYVVPSFSIHLWDGPKTATTDPKFELPPNVYSAFLDFGWQSDPNQMFGLELGLRVGAFTEFSEFRGDSLRLLGKGLASFRLTPATTFKAGVYYLDRRSIKLLPAVGWLWQPNPNTRVDVFFPQPKIARYWRTLGTNDVWWYVSGDYGGGSWTLDRDNETVDINDIRVMAGFEWGISDLIRAGRRSGFFEIGYVFDREVVFEKLGATMNTDDGFMIRLGIGY